MLKKIALGGTAALGVLASIATIAQWGWPGRVLRADSHAPAWLLLALMATAGVLGWLCRQPRKFSNRQLFEAIVSAPIVIPSPQDYTDDIIENIRWHWPWSAQPRVEDLRPRCARCAGDVQSLNVPPWPEGTLPIGLPDTGRGYTCQNPECESTFEGGKYQTNQQLKEAVIRVIPARLRNGTYREAPTRLERALRPEMRRGAS